MKIATELSVYISIACNINDNMSQYDVHIESRISSNRTMNGFHHPSEAGTNVGLRIMHSEFSIMQQRWEEMAVQLLLACPYANHCESQQCVWNLTHCPYYQAPTNSKKIWAAVSPACVWTPLLGLVAKHSKFSQLLVVLLSIPDQCRTQDDRVQ